MMAGAASGLELYCDPSCLIGEAPESEKEVSRLAYSLVIELELGVPSGI